MSTTYALDALLWAVENVDSSLSLNQRDDQLCEALLNTQRTKLHDLVGLFLNSHGIYADDKERFGPQKWLYNEHDPCDSFDAFVRSGCSNCGASYDFLLESDIPLNGLALACKVCGHRPCPMHTDVESDSVLDVFRDDEEKGTPGGVYLRGTRRVHDFGQNTKSWWQAYYLPRRIREDMKSQDIFAGELASGLTGQRVKETCEACGHDEAFFTTFQARSADEGATIIYECVRCHVRRTFNN